jgi:hypothetical protein
MPAVSSERAPSAAGPDVEAGGAWLEQRRLAAWTDINYSEK